MYEQSRWVEDTVWESRSQIGEMCETLRSLSTRMDNLEAYLGLQDGAQPIAMYDGSATITYRTLGGASWRRDRGLAERMDGIEDIAGPLSSPSVCKVLETDENIAEHVEDIADAVTIAGPTHVDSDGRPPGDTLGLPVAVAGASTETLPVPVPYSEGEAAPVPLPDNDVPVPVPAVEGMSAPDVEVVPMADVTMPMPAGEGVPVPVPVHDDQGMAVPGPVAVADGAVPVAEEAIAVPVAESLPVPVPAVEDMSTPDIEGVPMPDVEGVPVPDIEGGPMPTSKVPPCPCPLVKVSPCPCPLPWPMVKCPWPALYLWPVVNLYPISHSWPTCDRWPMSSTWGMTRIAIWMDPPRETWPLPPTCLTHTWPNPNRLRYPCRLVPPYALSLPRCKIPRKRPIQRLWPHHFLPC